MALSSTMRMWWVDFAASIPVTASSFGKSCSGFGRSGSETVDARGSGCCADGGEVDGVVMELRVGVMFSAGDSNRLIQWSRIRDNL